MAVDNKRYAKAMDKLSVRRDLAFRELEQHTDEIAQKIPEIAILQRELSQTNVKLAKIILDRSSDSKKAIDELRNRNLEAQEIIERLLVANGYPKDYLHIRFHCPKCEDTGIVDGMRCSCLKELLTQIAVDELNEVSPLKFSDFSDFDPSYFSDQRDPKLGVVPRETMTKIASYCEKYAQMFTMDSPSILMLGATGLGKTHLSLAIAKEATKKGYQVLYCTAQDVLRNIEREHFSRDNTDDQTLQTVLNTDLLVLDDLGAEFPTSFSSAAVYNIVNTRLSFGRPTIISTNLTSQELESRYSERVVSRLLTQYTYLRFVGEDVRQIKRRMK